MKSFWQLVGSWLMLFGILMFFYSVWILIPEFIQRNHTLIGLYFALVKGLGTKEATDIAIVFAGITTIIVGFVAILEIAYQRRLKRLR